MFLIKPGLIKPLILLAFFLLLSVSSHTWAGQTFARGVNSARAGDYAGALKIFHSLYESGNTSSELIYNLAACYYRLGEYSDAHQHFSTLLDDKDFRAIAAYNMGLIEAKLGDDLSAVNSFKRSLDSLDPAGKPADARLLALNEKALRIISKRNAGYLDNLSRPWRASIELGLAYDNNALLLDQQAQLDVQQTSDALLTSNILLQKWISGRRNGGNKFSLMHNSQRYQSVDANISQSTLSLGHYQKLSAMTKSITSFELSQSSYLSYRDRIYSAKYKLFSRFSDQRRMDLSYRYQWVEPEVKSEYWRGSSQQIKGRLSVGELGKYVSFAAHYDLNNRIDKVDEQPQSYSPLRFGYQVAYFYQKLRQAYWFSYAYRVSRYRGDTYDIQTIGNEVSQVNILRVDRKKTFNLIYRYSFNRKLSCSAGLIREINTSNRAASNYQQNIVSTGLRYEF